MKTILAFLLLSLLVSAAVEDETALHKEWMDAAQDVKDDLKDALDAKSHDKALEPGEKLVKFAEREEAYWRKRKVGDAVGLAQENLAASRAIVTAVREDRFDQTAQAYARLEATCRACHDLHPEKHVSP